MVPKPEDVLRRSLRRWRIATAISVLLVIAVAVLAIYSVMDQAVTLMYRDTELDNLRESEALLEDVALRVSTSTTRAELMELVKISDSGAFEKEGAIHADMVGFYFDDDGKLACITRRYPPEDSPCAAFARRQQ